MAYFRCTTGGSGKGNTLVVTCADDLAGATITCTNGTKTYRKTCPSTSPYEVTFYGLEAGTWTVSATVSGNTYTTTVVITDYEAELGGFSWKAWVDLSQNYTSSDFTDLDDLLSDETAVRELMIIHACVDYLAGIATASADVEKIINNDLCAKWINLSDYALDTLYANEIIADYMDEADKYFYGEWVNNNGTWGAKGNVPIMTSNTAPYGEAFGTAAQQTGREAYKAFDGDSSTFAVTYGASASTSPTVEKYIGYNFGKPTFLSKVSIYSGLASAYAGNFEIQGSDDGTTWTKIGDTHTFSTTDALINIPITDNVAYSRYRIYTLSGNNKNGSNQYYINLMELQFYGRELSVSVPVMTSNTTPYGEVSASGANSGREAWKAFDDSTDITSYWLASGTSAWIQYHFTSQINPRKMIIDSSSGNRIASYTLKGSNDGINFTPITSGTNSQTGTVKIIKDFECDEHYSYLRLDVTSNESNTGEITRLYLFGEDYSEKEFETGTTKKWLYDHGVELETLTTEATAGTVTKQSDSILINCTSGGSTYARVRTDAIDFTPYDLLRVKVGKELVSGGQSRFGIASVASRDSYLADVGNVAIGTQVPNNTGLDISSYNSSYYPNVYNADTGGKLTLVEWWLE